MTRPLFSDDIMITGIYTIKCMENNHIRTHLYTLAFIDKFRIDTIIKRNPRIHAKACKTQLLRPAFVLNSALYQMSIGAKKVVRREGDISGGRKSGR